MLPRLLRFLRPRRPPVVFMHIPKCAGTAFSRSIEAAVKATHVLRGFGAVCFGTGVDLQAIPRRKRAKIFLNGLPRKNFDFVSGHFSYSSLRVAYPDGRFITVLREPRVRLLSDYLFARGLDGKKLDRWGKHGGSITTARENLVDYLGNRSMAYGTDNIYVRYLLSPHPAIPQDDFIRPEQDAELLRQAKERMLSFGCAGVLEDPMLETKVSSFLGVDFSLKRHNVTSSHGAFPLDLLAEAKAAKYLITELTRLDVQLWQALADHHGITTLDAEATFSGYVRKQAEVWKPAGTRSDMTSRG